MSSTLDDGPVLSSHIVGFFDDELGFAASVGDFLADAVQSGEIAIAIVTEAHRLALTSELRGRGVDVDKTVTMLDASATLGLFMSDGHLDRDSFHVQMGALLRSESVPGGSPIRVFGEMVALLWEAGQVNQAIELESLWNELGENLRFSLYCAYPASTVCQAGHAESLRRMCQLHTHSFDVPSRAERDRPRTENRRVRFKANVSAPHAVRQFVEDALGEWGLADSLINNAVLVSSELAANAVVHTGAPFWVTLSFSGPVIRLEFRDVGSPFSSDGEPALVVRRERGLGIVSSFTNRWGSYGEGRGKVVWAEFDRGAFP